MLVNPMLTTDKWQVYINNGLEQLSLLREQLHSYDLE